MTTDSRRLVLPEPLASDGNAFEIVSAWFAGGRVFAMTATGTGLEHNPEAWGQILAAIANNAAVSTQQAVGADYSATLAKMKSGLDKHWQAMAPTQGSHCPS